MKSYIKLYGPSIYKGLEAMDDLIKNLKKRFQYGEMISHIIGMIDPSLDLITGSLIRGGTENVGEYDYTIEWAQPPSFEQLRSLIRHIDDTLAYTGCMYTITTK